MLGKHPSVISVGELISIGDRGFHDNQLCSCGKPFRECAFWTEVVTLVAGPSPSTWFARLARLRENVVRIRYVPALALSRHDRTGIPLTAQSVEYIDMLGEVTAAIAAVAGVNIVIDSSKHPPSGFFLSKCKTFDLYPAHLIRDCRAVAFSQQRTMVRPEIYWTTELMPRFSPAKTAFDWTLFNSLMHLLGNVAGRYCRIRYEDMVKDPNGVSQMLLDWVGADPSVPSHSSTKHHGIGEHELSGNPMRFQHEFKVIPDVEWLTNMSACDKAVATAISAPLLAKYGYNLMARPESR
jgi:hypothetical protein